MHLDEEGWRKLTLRWGCSSRPGRSERIRAADPKLGFLAGFKSFGIMPLTVIFALSQTPLILKHEIKPEAEEPHF